MNLENENQQNTALKAASWEERGGQKGVSPEEEKLRPHPVLIQPAFLAVSLCRLTSGFQFRSRKSFYTTLALLKCKIAWLCSLETHGVRMMKKADKLRNRRLWNYLEMRPVVPAG